MIGASVGEPPDCKMWEVLCFLVPGSLQTTWTAWSQNSTLCAQRTYDRSSWGFKLFIGFSAYEWNLSKQCTHLQGSQLLASFWEALTQCAGVEFWSAKGWKEMPSDFVVPSEQWEESAVPSPEGSRTRLSLWWAQTTSIKHLRFLKWIFCAKATLF